jgi:hypothetical protein
MDLVVTRVDVDEELLTRTRAIHFSDKLSEIRYYERLDNFVVPAPGEYFFTLFANAEWVAQRRLRVYLRGAL